MLKFYDNFMFIYVNITDRQTDRQTNTSKVQFGTSQKYDCLGGRDQIKG